jgi:hypothetical protein
MDPTDPDSDPQHCRQGYRGPVVSGFSECLAGMYRSQVITYAYNIEYSAAAPAQQCQFVCAVRIFYRYGNSR